MPKVRYEIEGRLSTLSPMHVGSGAFGERATVIGDGKSDPPQVALIVRDADDAPYIPASTLKGLLVRLAKRDGVEETARDELFGTIKVEEKGRMGALILRGATRVGSGPDVSAAPFTGGEVAPAKLGRGVFVAARTRIDGETGTAEDGKLFFQEMVAPHTSFAFRALIEARGAKAEESAKTCLETLLPLLRRWATTEGQAVGKGQADGFGRLRLDPDSVRIKRRVLTSKGTFADSDDTALWRAVPDPARDVTARTLRLVCDGPFAVIDASRKGERAVEPETDPTGKKKARPPQLQAQRWDERLPLLLGSSLSGALRARAQWLSARAALRGEPNFETSGSDGWTRVQRLFGETGYRGLLSIDRLEVEEAEPWNVTSVKLDRFSGAPVDNALFTTATFLGVQVIVTLRLDEKRCKNEDERQFDDLLKDVCERGIELGHGANKGFGWFRVEEVGDVR